MNNAMCPCDRSAPSALRHSNTNQERPHGRRRHRTPENLNVRRGNFDMTESEAKARYELTKPDIPWCMLSINKRRTLAMLFDKRDREEALAAQSK